MYSTKYKQFSLPYVVDVLADQVVKEQGGTK